MGLTNFPNGITSFGAPIGPSNFAGWWGKDVYFVDDESGSDDNPGKSPTTAYKTIQAAITASSIGDTIFLKPREVNTSTHSSHGYYTGSNIIPNTKTGLAIIGTGRGGRGLGMGAQCMVEPDSGSTDVCFEVKPPCVSFENMGMKCVTGASGAIHADFIVENAWGMTISNVFFKDFKTTGTTTGTINLDNIHWSTVQHCYFREASCAINHVSSYSAVKNIVIRDCDFVGAASTWSTDIRVGDVSNMVIDNCRFAHPQPTGGSRNLYLDMVGTSGTGMISNCTISSTQQGVTVLFGLKGSVLQSNVWSDGTAAVT